MNIDKVIHSLPRLRIMELLSKGNFISHTELVRESGLSSGNLHSHCRVLQTAGYLVKSKKVTSAIFSVSYQITPLGLQEFNRYIDQVTLYLANIKNSMDRDLIHHLPPSIFVEILDLEGNKLILGEFD